jgi:hypothetical protein
MDEVEVTEIAELVFLDTSLLTRMNITAYHL